MSGPAPQGPNDGRVGIVEGWELQRGHKQTANSGAFKGLAFVVVAIGLLIIGGWFAARPYMGPAITGLFENNPGVINLPVVADLLRLELGDRLDTPAGSGNEEIEFVVAPGQSVDQIQENLIEQGLLTDTLAFKYSVVSNRVDQLIEAGVYTMTPQITPAQIASRLAANPDPPTPVTVLALRAGWRLEQIVAYLQQQVEKTDLELVPNEFLTAARNPGPELRDEYSFLKQAPNGSSLEGFLAGGVYEVPVDITADDLLRQLLDQWQKESGDLIAEARKKKIDFYDAMKVASLVEREAKVDKDRAKIAGVYWNRINPKVNNQTNGLMQADPTVVYATDTMALDDLAVKKWDKYLFWDTLGLADYSTVNVDKRLSSFQTYQNSGLPDWPIATPTRKSLEAALNPKTGTKKLFFYACEGSDTHTFAKTFKQHQNNIAACN